MFRNSSVSRGSDLPSGVVVWQILRSPSDSVLCLSSRCWFSPDKRHCPMVESESVCSLRSSRDCVLLNECSCTKHSALTLTDWNSVEQKPALLLIFLFFFFFCILCLVLLTAAAKTWNWLCVCVCVGERERGGGRERERERTSGLSQSVSFFSLEGEREN